MSIVYKRVLHFSMHGHHTCPAEVEEKEVKIASRHVRSLLDHVAHFRDLVH